MQETQETRVQPLSREDPLEQEMATHSSTFVWKIPWTEEPGRVQSMGLQRVDTTEHRHTPNHCEDLTALSITWASRHKAVYQGAARQAGELWPRRTWQWAVHEMQGANAHPSRNFPGRRVSFMATVPADYRQQDSTLPPSGYPLPP